MTTTAGTIRTVLEMDSSDFTIKTVQAGRVISELNGKMAAMDGAVRSAGGGFDGFGRSLHNNLVNLAAVKYLMLDLHEVFLSFPAAVVKTAGEIERLTMLMQQLSTKSTVPEKMAEAKDNIAQLFQLAQNSPFAVNKLTDSFVKLKTGGLDPLNGPLQALIDGVAAVGGDSGVMQRASLAIMQMLGKGAISMEELRKQLGEAMPKAMQQMARGMNLSVAELLKLVKTGAVESSNAVTKMLAQMALESGGSARKMMDSWVGMMAQLENKWELFKLAVSQSALFENAKEKLRELLAAFDSRGAATFANTLGQLFSKTLDVMASVVRFTRDWGSELLHVAAAMAAVWAVGKITSAFNTSPMTLAFKAARQAEIDLVTEGVAASEKRVAALEAAKVKQLAMIDQQIAAERKYTIQSILEGAKRKQAELANLAAQVQAKEVAIAQNKAADEAALEASIAAQQKIFTTIRNLGEYGGKNIIANQQSIISSSTAQMNGTKALEAEANALKARQAALIASNAATVAAVNEENAMLAVLRQKQLNMQQATAATLAAEAATTKLSWATGLVKGAMEGFKSLLGLIVNPITIAVAVLYSLYKIYEAITDAANRTSAAQLRQAQIAANIKKGIASEDDVDNARKDLETLKAKRAELQTQRDALTNARPMPDEISPGNSDKTLDAIDAEMKHVDDLMKKATQNLFEGGLIVVKNQAKVFQQGFDLAVTEAMQTGGDKFNAAQQELHNKAAEAIQALNVDPVKNAAKIKAIQDKLISDDKELRRGYLNEQTQVLNEQAAKYEEISMNAAGKYGEAEQRGAEQQLKLIREVRMQKQKDLIALFDSGNPLTKPTKPDPVHIKSEDPLNVLLQETEANAQRAKDRVKNISDDVRDINDLRQEAWDALQGKLRAGGLDHNVYDAKGKRIDKNKDRRQLAGLGLDELMNSSNPAASDLVRIVKATANIEEYKKALTASTEDSKQVVAATTEMDEAYDRLTSNGLEKMTPAMATLTKTFAEQNKTFEGNADILSLLDEKQKKAFAGRAFSDLANFASDAKLGAMHDEIDLITNRDEKTQASYDFDQKQAQARYDMLRSFAEKFATIDNPKYLNIMAEANAGWYYSQEVAQKKHFEAMKSPMQKLADEWSDSTARMQDASRSWVEDFAQRFTDFMKTGKFDFAEFATSVIADIVKIKLEATVAKPLANLMDNVGSGLLNMLGLGGGGLGSGLTSTGGGNGEHFAMGGIMSSAGSMPLNRYAMGGVATRPQLAMFGEGSRPEAYVPLPDGRSIPVNMQGGGGNVQINVINNSGTQVEAQQSQPRFDGAKMICDVVLSAMSRPGSFRDGMKGAIRT